MFLADRAANNCKAWMDATSFTAVFASYARVSSMIHRA